MNRLGAAILIAVLFVGCATIAPPPPTTDDARAMACHADAFAYAERTVPYVDTSRLAMSRARDWTPLEIAAAPLFIAHDIASIAVGTAFAIATAPILVPWRVQTVQADRRAAYAREYESCMKGAPPEPTAEAPPAE